MQLNKEALKSLELKLAAYSKENGVIAEHASSNMNSCNRGCFNQCDGSCKSTCSGSCQWSKNK